MTGDTCKVPRYSTFEQAWAWLPAIYPGDEHDPDRLPRVVYDRLTGRPPGTGLAAKVYDTKTSAVLDLERALSPSTPASTPPSPPSGTPGPAAGSGGRGGDSGTP